MNDFYIFSHRFKRSMIEIASNVPYESICEYLKPLQKEKLPDSVKFTVASGKKAYDIIGFHNSWEEFYSQRIIDVLSLFIDMSNKCYPINIEGIEKTYYVIYNLDSAIFLNKDRILSMYDPHYYDIQGISSSIFGVRGTLSVIVSKEVKNAFLKNKITNIELVECFDCSLEEFDLIKKEKKQPEVHVFRDK